MKKIYSFKKEILFKNNIYEILSIAIDKKFTLDGYAVKGQFRINGEYLIKENESDTFDIEIPYLNYIEDNYDVSKIKVDIDDFYYEIKDSNHLIINIDVAIDGLEEKELVNEEDEFEIEVPNESRNNEILDLIEDVEAKGELIDDIDPPDNIQEVAKEVNIAPTINSNFETKNNDEFVTYRVCIVRENDTIESIMEKYHINMEVLQKYNVINEIKIGDKLIIPYERN